MTAPLTYVYCLVADRKPPSTARRPKGLPGLGPLRLLQVGERALWLAVADAPAESYREKAINAGLRDLDWVSRAAVAHEAVVESFLRSAAVLPMKLFTIFTSDARALEYIGARRSAIDAALDRVTGHDEWGIRVALDRSRPAAAARSSRTARSGVSYLQRKKAQRDATAELAGRARDIVAELYDRLAGVASAARRRAAAEMPAQGGPLLLDAAFLVPRSRAKRFNAAVRAQTKVLGPQGYAIALSGPWPAYSFMQD
ncbi:MAG TPA: GvpL/GvpF family gas vesicle protein [Vicinamibacterales bacterium]